MTTTFASTVVIDRRQKPSHGYRAVHVVVTSARLPIEVQVRTDLQHLWAETSEKLSDVVDPAIKYGGGPQVTQEKLQAWSEMIAEVETLELDLLNEVSKVPPARRQRPSWRKIDVMLAQLGKKKRDAIKQAQNAIAKFGNPEDEGQ